MAWIEFHPTRIIKLRKFQQVRKHMNWSVSETLGNLGMFWGHTLEVQEDGNITGWDACYVEELMGFGAQVSERFLDALVANGWIDKYEDGTMLIHDWLDYAGTFLRGKYAKDYREKLVNIWSVHGRNYGKKQDKLHENVNIDNKDLPIGNQLVTNRKPIVPNLTTPHLTKPKDICASHSQCATDYPQNAPPKSDKQQNADKKRELGNLFESLWAKYPRKLGKKHAKRHFLASVKTEKDQASISIALQKYLDFLDEEKVDAQFIKHGSTWFNTWQDWPDYESPREPKDLLDKIREEYGLT